MAEKRRDKKGRILRKREMQEDGVGNGSITLIHKRLWENKLYNYIP